MSGVQHAAAMPMNTALVNLAGMRRNRDDIMNEIKITDELKRVPEKIRRQKI